MSSVTILGHSVKLVYAGDPVPPEIANCVIDMAAVIDGETVWTPDQRAILTGMNTITLFAGSVSFGMWDMTRSFCDQANADFYWLDTDIEAYPSPEVMASYFAHDCVHLRQWRANGVAQNTADAVAREVAACDLQIEIAKALNCPPYVIEFLEGYMNDPAQIYARVESGEACTIHGGTHGMG